MALMAVVWHWWIAPLLVALTVLAIIATIAGYVKVVHGQRYPPRGKERAVRVSRSAGARPQRPRRRRSQGTSRVLPAHRGES